MRWTPVINTDKYYNGQYYRIGTAQKMSVDVDATPNLLLLIQQKLRIV